MDAAIAAIRKDHPGAKLEKPPPTTAPPPARRRPSASSRRWTSSSITSASTRRWASSTRPTSRQRLFEVNILSGVRLARHYLKSMLERKTGRIIFISSESAISPSPEMAHYAATKTMQLSISRSLAELTKGTAVTVNTVLPGSTKSAGVEKFVQDLFPGEPLEAPERRFMRENRPTSLIERLIDPAEIAHFVTFVSSPLASAINGAALRVDGGLVRSVF